jgi:rSAM/selenodomain-associated transferase 1
MAATIGVMARAPVAGRCKTRLAASVGDAFAAELCRAMLLDTLAAIERVFDSNRLVVMAAPDHGGAPLLRTLAPRRWEVVAQEGEGLGARLAHAFTTLGAGGDPVALVDSDSPTVSWEAAERALARLRGPRRVCMGPCTDGGYWLIAMTTIELRILEGIAWSTPAVALETRARCSTLGLALEELPVGRDVDAPDDLAWLREELRRHPECAPHTAAMLGRA